MSGGKTVVYGKGSRWKVTKGEKVSIYNNGDKPHAHQIWRLIRKK